MAFAAAGLEKGWAVAMPDAAGVDNHMFTPKVMGYTTLDGIRAAENFEPMGLSGAQTPTAMWGYSGGAITSQWAAELQPTYAPDLNIVGAALGAPVPDVFSIMGVDGWLSGGLLALTFASISADSPDLRDRIGSLDLS